MRRRIVFEDSLSPTPLPSGAQVFLDSSKSSVCIFFLETMAKESSTKGEEGGDWLSEMLDNLQRASDEALEIFWCVLRRESIKN